MTRDASVGLSVASEAAAGLMMSSDTLRQVAEEVRTAFPHQLHAPELVLIDVDPRHLHAFWTLSAATVDSARQALGRDGSAAPMVLRIYEVSSSGSDGAAFDVEVVGLQGRCYVDIWDEPRRYRGELGLRRPDGEFVSLAGSAVIELPPTSPSPEQGPSALNIAATRSERRGEQTPAPSEPVRHSFPLPPSEPSDFLPEHPAAGAAAAGDAEIERRQVAARPSDRETALPFVQPEPPGPATRELPKPIRHPFPLPSAEPTEFAPEALIGGFLPLTPEPSPEHPWPPEPAALPPERREPAPAGDTPPAEARVPTEGGSGPLPLENVLTLSSYALGRETVEFEVNAELHIFGRARPGTQLQLFGRKVALRPDGSFSISRPLPSGALVLSSLLVGDNESGDQ